MKKLDNRNDSVKEPSAAQRLLQWYALQGRTLPWRGTTDPYAIWVSEVLLQQTRVAQGMPYYHRFMQRFPTLASLAQAPLDDVLKLWEGLGYYRRGRLMHQAAQVLHQERRGVWPTTPAELELLPGIGPYTSRAIASLAFGYPAAVLDGNVFRVLARYHASHVPINSPSARAHFQPLADSLLGTAAPGLFNQAMMDLGATVCTPTRPLCSQCPLAPDCSAREQGSPEAYPLKSPRAAVQELTLHCRVVVHPTRGIVMRQRGPVHHPRIWQGLWEPPIDPAPPTAPGSQPLGIAHHVLTHRRLMIKVWQVPHSHYELSPDEQWLTADQLHKLALHRAAQRIMQAYGPNGGGGGLPLGLG